MHKPLVTVGIPYTDQGQLLAEAINSVLAQTSSAWELILYGDGPDAKTQRIAESFEDVRIRHIVTHERNGLSHALNRIAEETQTELLARMDGDDLMHPQRLEKQLDYFAAHPSIDVLGTRAYIIDENSKLVGSFNEPALPARSIDYFKSNAFTHPTVMGRTKWFLENRYDENLVRSEDKELWMRAHQTSKFAKLEERLLFYRVPSTVSWRKQAKDSAYDRRVILRYSSLVSRSFVARKLLVSYVKQAMVFALCKMGLDSIVYTSKYSPLPEAELSLARQTLHSLVRHEEYPVLAVTVTYGDRVSLVTRTVDSALNAGATEAVVIANGTTPEVTDDLRRRLRNMKARVHHLPTNDGSAAGFHAAISQALGTKYDYYWLLDDDNVVAEGDVRLLQNTLIAANSRTPTVGVASVRRVDERHQRVINGQPAHVAYPPRGAFLYFDIVNLILSKVYSAKPGNKPLLFPAAIPNAPYGGLMVDRTTVERVGLPDLRLGLYEDDTEWTSRISRTGTLLLSPDVVIDDIDGKHTHGHEGNGASRLLQSESPTRAYFATRNRVLWESQQLTKASEKARYLVNRFVYIGILTIEKLQSKRNAEYADLREAIRAGESADLTVRLDTRTTEL